jgi:hypothetical protein
VLFLDHDGVICLEHNWGSRKRKQSSVPQINQLLESHRPIPVYYRFDDFDSQAVSILNEILSISKAEIVVMSSWWQFATLDEMREYYHRYGISKLPIDMPNPLDESRYKTVRVRAPRLSAEHHRKSFDIRHFLDQTPSVKYWVAVDDSDLQPHPDFWVDNFVRIDDVTSGICGPGIKEKILSYFPNDNLANESGILPGDLY